MKALRHQPSWSSDSLQVSPSQAVPVQGVKGPSWLATFSLKRGDAAASGLLLRSWLHQEPEQEQPSAAALLLDWEQSQLQVGQTWPMLLYDLATVRLRLQQTNHDAIVKFADSCLQYMQRDCLDTDCAVCRCSESVSELCSSHINNACIDAA